MAEWLLFFLTVIDVPWQACLMHVPFVDLKTQYSKIRSELNAAIKHVLDDGAFVLGPDVKQFENEFAAYLNIEHCVGVNSGTDALIFAFRALGLKKGDEVILPANTYVATAIGVVENGATPVLVDIDPTTYLMDTKQFESCISPRTKAICPVHLYGRVCNMDDICAFAKKHSLFVVEDVAQAHGARWNSKHAGTFGEYGCFSFYPSKNLGCLGDGGAVTSESEDLSGRIKKLRNYGSEIKYHHPERGINSRLDTLQAAVLSVNLKHLDNWNNKRWEAAKYYHELLGDIPREKLELPQLCDSHSHIFHLFVIQVDNREKIQEKLKKSGVDTSIHYPLPFYLQEGYSDLWIRKGQYPITEQFSPRILSLPMYPEITTDQLEFVAEQLKTALLG